MDTQALLDLCRINEEARGFDLGSWTSTKGGCGTVGCLVGNFCLARPNDELRLSDGRGQPLFPQTRDAAPAIAKRFGISVGEAQWLFSMDEIERNQNGFVSYGAKNWRPFGYSFRSGGNRDCYDRESAIRRVRKLIYWKLKRREFMYEDDGRVRESARRLEGDHNFASQTLACC
jgi:hypothetical protein